jgi:hypothetical protein
MEVDPWNEGLAELRKRITDGKKPSSKERLIAAKMLGLN